MKNYVWKCPVLFTLIFGEKKRVCEQPLAVLDVRERKKGVCRSWPKAYHRLLAISPWHTLLMPNTKEPLASTRWAGTLDFVLHVVPHWLSNIFVCVRFLSVLLSHYLCWPQRHCSCATHPGMPTLAPRHTPGSFCIAAPRQRSTGGDIRLLMGCHPK